MSDFCTVSRVASDNETAGGLHIFIRHGIRDARRFRHRIDICGGRGGGIDRVIPCVGTGQAQAVSSDRLAGTECRRIKRGSAACVGDIITGEYGIQRTRQDCGVCRSVKVFVSRSDTASQSKRCNFKLSNG